VKRSAALGIALFGVLGGLPAAAQQAGKTYRVGILTGRTLAFDRPLLEAFRHAMAGLGYREGKNLEIIYRGAGGDMNRIPALAADLVRAKPDAIVAAAILAIAASKRATTTVPIVMTQVSDPVGARFIGSLARPGGNITGTSNMNAELEGKRLQLLDELVPRLRRVAVTRNPTNPADLTQWRETESEAHALGVQVFAVDIRSGDQIDAALGTLAHQRADALIVLPDGVTLSNAARIVRLVAAQRLPTIYQQGAFMAAGGLIAYGASETADWSRAATYVDRILKGAKPADLPVERPTTFELIVNLKTARALGLTVPQSILLRTTEVIR
jgi:putative tryptophan/tyrosine transport system substrate-binding protein